MASSTLGHMWIYQGMNNLRASQARLSTNPLADQVESAFETDYDLEHEYHTILDGTLFGFSYVFGVVGLSATLNR